MSTARRPRIVVLGMMANMPFGGVVWQTLHYLIGFERLGYEVFYVEAHGRSPSMLLHDASDDPWLRTGEFLHSVLEPYGLADRWAVWPPGAAARDACGPAAALHPDLYRDAAAVLNLHGGTEPREEMAAGDHLVFVETDPVRLQVELLDGEDVAMRMLEPHAAVFTFAENCGKADCGLPVSDRFEFLPTRQPVIVDLWSPNPRPVGERFTTVGNWRQAWRHVQLDGETYFWSKHREFEKVLALPARTKAGFELCLSNVDEESEAKLHSNGWVVRAALPMSLDPARYREYVQGSRGEFTVAKDQNVRLKTGWFSDRSATYLAAGRPVVTQDTGFGDNIPVGSGLFAFSDLDSAAEAVEAIERDHERHARAALEVAKEHFAATRVLGSMLQQLGLSIRGAPTAAAPAKPSVGLPLLPADLDLTPTRRRPMALTPATERFGGSLTQITSGVVGRAAPAEPEVTVVIVSFGHPELSALCLASLLGDDGLPDLEVLVVDNYSGDENRSALRRLAGLDRRVTLVEMPGNDGFASAANAGIDRARGEVVVLLNNDVVLTPGWLLPLTARLALEEVGAIGPVTNRSATAARIETSYRTYGELLELAARRGAERKGRFLPVPMLEMFCFAARRAVLRQVGPLDTRFGTGLFEDDDYCRRLADAGLRLEVAEDAFVHHFGEGTLGDLHQDGSYGQLFQRNRRLFEEKWVTDWPGHERRPDGHYEEVCSRVATLSRGLQATGGVAVISRGDPGLVPDGARHFPGDEHGAFAGWYPRDDDQAVAELYRARSAGARFLVIPAPAAWWLDHYEHFGRIVRDRLSPLFTDDTCTVFTLEALDGGDEFGTRRGGQVPVAAGAPRGEVGGDD